MTGRINIVLIEHSYFLVSGFTSLIAEFPGLFLVAQYDGSEKNLESRVLHHEPDLVVLNPDLFTDTLYSAIREFSDNAIVAAFVTGTTPDNIRSHFDYCIDLTLNKHELLGSFRTFLEKRLQRDRTSPADSPLSSREQMIVREVVSGFTNQEIADKLFLSIHTVNTHRKNISNKLGIKTVSGLTVYALMNKIVDIHEIRQ